MVRLIAAVVVRLAVAMNPLYRRLNVDYDLLLKLEVNTNTISILANMSFTMFANQGSACDECCVCLCMLVHDCVCVCVCILMGDRVSYYFRF